MAIEITGRLENWTITHKDNIHGPVYWGHVYDDTKGRFRDGAWIHTSHVTKRVGKTIHTLNSVYKLGKKGKNA